MSRKPLSTLTKKKKLASVYTHNLGLQNTLLSLCESHPAQVRQTSGDRYGSMTFELPKKWVKIAPPRVLSEAQKKGLWRI